MMEMFKHVQLMDMQEHKLVTLNVTDGMLVLLQSLVEME